MTFALDQNPSPEELSAAINYILANIQTSNAADSVTGQITDYTGNVVAYLYKYIYVKYADSFDGTVNFSDSPVGRGYYGLRNSDSSTESTNPADYIWTKVVGGFGSTRSLYYLTTGGRQIQFAVGTTAPNTGWAVDPGTAIDLDIITSAKGGPANFIVNRITSATTAPTDAECISAIGRTPIVGDLCTVVYSSGLGSILYKYQIAGWAVWQPYISTDLILANTIVGSNIAANTITGNNIAANTITAANIAANTITGNKIAAATISAGNMAANSITATNAALDTASVATLNIQGNAVTVPASANGTTTGVSVVLSCIAGQLVYVSGFANGYGAGPYDFGGSGYLYVNGSLFQSAYAPVIVYMYSGNTGTTQTVCAGTYLPPSTGNYTFTFSANGSSRFASIFAIQTKR